MGHLLTSELNLVITECANILAIIFEDISTPVTVIIQFVDQTFSIWRQIYSDAIAWFKICVLFFYQDDIYEQLLSQKP